MLALFRTPRWAIATLVVVVLCAVFASLGRWQLQRHQERAVENTVNAQRLSAPPVSLGDMLEAAGGDVTSLEYRRVVVTGRFDPANEILVRSQVANERPGFHVVTPLVTQDSVVLVNRGWVPLAVERPPVTGAPPPSGAVTVEGVVRLGQTRPSIGPIEPEGRLDVVARIDLERLGQQFTDLAPVWVQQTDPPAGDLPIRLPLPDTDDPGPHLPYAVQWFSFAVIAAGGYGLLVRRALPGRR
ncbi:MAG: SURF1 family protein [Acidimicrobiia bacterium]